MLRTLLTIAERRPALFQPLASKDEGHDPGKFETGLLRDRLAKRDACAAASVRLEAIQLRLKDTSLRFGELTRPVLLSGYHILKPVAEHDTELRGWLAPVTNFYARPKGKSHQES